MKDQTSNFVLLTFLCFPVASQPLVPRCVPTPATKMPISALYLLDAKGKVIISRDYRGDIPIKCLERFITHVLETDENDLKPIFEEDGISYIYIKYNSLFGTICPIFSERKLFSHVALSTSCQWCLTLSHSTYTNPIQCLPSAS